MKQINKKSALIISLVLIIVFIFIISNKPKKDNSSVTIQPIQSDMSQSFLVWYYNTIGDYNPDGTIPADLASMWFNYYTLKYS